MVTSLVSSPASAATPSLPSFSLWRASAAAVPAGAPGRFRHRAKFLARSLLQPRLTRAWLGRLVQPDLAPLWQLRPRLASKLQRPYVSSEWNDLVKFAALLGHYDTLPSLFSLETRRTIYQHGLDLLRFQTRVGRRLLVRLSYADQFEKEGELTLSMCDATSGLALAAATFVLARRDDTTALIIGGLQANPDPRTRELIHDVAKEMFGLRPKAFVFWAVQQCAAAWNVARIEAVCDAQHIYRHRHKRRAIHASYDQFWTECDGERQAGGGWVLPLQPRERSSAELKPSRRKQHEQRYAAFRGLQPALADALWRAGSLVVTSPATAGATLVFSDGSPASTEAAA